MNATADLTRVQELNQNNSSRYKIPEVLIRKVLKVLHIIGVYIYLQKNKKEQSLLEITSSNTAHPKKIISSFFSTLPTKRFQICSIKV